MDAVVIRWAAVSRRRDTGAVRATLEAARLALESNPRQAERRAARAVRDVRRLEDRSLRAEALTVWAEALLALERHGDARAAAGEGAQLAPWHARAWRAAATSARRSAEPAEAVTALRRLVELRPRDAEAWHELGRASWWTGDRDGAGEAFGRAARLDPRRFVVPIRVATVEFQRIAVEVWRSIPDPFQTRMANTMATIEELPDAEDVADGLDPDVLGLYEGGTALEEADWFERILIFQRNHEAVCATLGELREEVRRTILHEVGHHFGMDHDELPY
ncbi:MAG: metallopeptidase family protein [Candidatus Dormibacteria bacterium]